MSHFGVLVIGNDVEKQLAPYHEFECTGKNDEYVQDVDVTEEIRGLMTGDDALSLEDALGYHGLEDKIVADESEVDKAGDDCEHKFGYAIVKSGQLVKAVNRTNPNKTWDWWVVGGRWSGFLKLRHGADGEVGRPGIMGSCANSGPGRADVTTKGAVDFSGMRDEAGAEAAADWDKAAAARGEATWISWDQMRDVEHKGNIDAARAAYGEQPAVQGMRKVFDYPLHSVDQYATPRDQFIQQARDRASVLYAVVKDGQWIAKGEMGWFGMSTDAESQADWNAKVNEMLDALPDDTPLTVVDCHI
ncbi:hypothetical protein SAMN05216359_105322 [Roseateles sp. YR242]|uniref:hypothetical protein n=1 Tax=Roseateles sp. YR242 TaxID=1855305 RepID=UPI0008C7109C|nr:hypothetical protein [Roseateles sp. YR242]SEL13419.1 hypothetical protein SAMN05216359_105322 [Roseateles sp. YR242]